MVTGPCGCGAGLTWTTGFGPVCPGARREMYSQIEGLSWERFMDE